MAGRRSPRFASLLAILGATGFVRSLSAAPEANVAKTPSDSVDRYFSSLLLGIQKTELPSGLEVVLNVERGAPLVCVSTTFATGRAQGSSLPELVDALRHRRVAAGASDHALVRARGAVSYQSAGWEHSTFTEVLPADELPFALWLEGQRLRPLPQLPQTTRAVAQEAESAFSLLRPNERAAVELAQLAWAAGASGEPDLKLLNDWFFAPKHAVMTITGDFDGDEALRLLGEHMAEASPAPDAEGKAHAAAATATTSERAGPSEAGVDATSAELSVGFVVAGVGDPNHAAATLAAALLDRTERAGSGGLFAGQGTLAARVELSEARGRSLLAVHVSRRSPSRDTLSPKTVFDELRRLAGRPLTLPALEALRKSVLLRWLDQFASAKQRAELLGRYEVLHGDARLSGRYARDLAGVTPSDVARVLATLTADRAFVLGAGTPQKAAP